MLGTKELAFYLKSLKVYARYRANKKFPRLSSFFGVFTVPFGVYINVTTSCNLKCKHCIVGKNKTHGFPNWDKKRDKTIDKHLLLNAIKQAADMGVPLVSITGGEPLLVSNIDQAGKLAIKEGVIINLNTNGLMINEHNAETLVNSFDFIRVSLNGHEKIHEKLTGVRGSYNKTLKAIRLLMGVKSKRAKIGVNSVLNKQTLNILPGFIQDIEKEVDFIGVLPEFSFDQTSGKLAGLNKKEEKRLESTLNRINSFKKVYPKIDFDYFRLMKSSECDAGVLYVYVIPNGNVLQCPFVTERMVLTSKDYDKGDIKNLNRQPLRSIYESFKTKKLVNCVGCYANCTTGVTVINNCGFPKLLKDFLIKLVI